MKITLVTLLANFMVFLHSVESAPSGEGDDSHPDSNYRHQDRNPQYRHRYDRNNQYLGIRYGDEDIPAVPLYAGCGLYDLNDQLVGVFDGTGFYAEGDTGRRIVYPRNGYYAKYTGHPKTAIFENVWRPAPGAGVLSAPSSSSNNRLATRSRTHGSAGAGSSSGQRWRKSTK